MNKFLILIILSLGYFNFVSPGNQFIARQGQITFFSYTTVENIQANNNTVFSIIDTESNEIVISILMKAFTFEKPLMQSHFNESYIESDLYPKAIFTGEILDYQKDFEGIQTRIIKGDFTMHGITKSMEIKSQISSTDSEIIISGETT